MIGFTKLLSFIFKGKNWTETLPKGVFKSSRYHWYNMVNPSPWPILIGLNTFPTVIGMVGTMQGIISGLELFISSFFMFLFFFSMWNRDIIRESTHIGLHTRQVDKNTITGFKLFLFTETMLFVTFFWAHLYSALYPSVFIGLSWPPVGLAHLLLDPFDIPLVNTLILVYSGFTVTLSHLYLRRGKLFLSACAMVASIILGLAFLYIQKEEFLHSQFDISDGIYGSTFFMLTGFHGGHVIIGVTGLIITLYRLIELHFSSYSHTGFKLALIYWHFVDVVWIFVFLIVYVLGSDLTYPNTFMYINDDFASSSDIFGPKFGYIYFDSIINIEAATYGKYKTFMEFIGEDTFKNYYDKHEYYSPEGVNKIKWINSDGEKINPLLTIDLLNNNKKVFIAGKTPYKSDFIYSHPNTCYSSRVGKFCSLCVDFNESDVKNKIIIFSNNNTVNSFSKYITDDQNTILDKKTYEWLVNTLTVEAFLSKEIKMPVSKISTFK